MGKRILVADDSVTIQRAFAMVLAGSEFELAFAKNADEALLEAKRGVKPDLVVADVALGADNGYDLCTAVKADSALRGTPVYLLASTQNPYDESRGRRVGADGSLTKPFDSQVLLDSLRQAVAPKISAAAPSPEVDDGDTTRLTQEEAMAESVYEDDDYGEIVIERAPAPASWGARVPSQPAPTQVAQPSQPAPAVSRPSPTTPAPRPSLIPGARPVVPTPPMRPMTPPISPLPAQSSPSAAVNRTIMGLPSIKPLPSQAPVAQPPAAVAKPKASPPTTPPPFPIGRVLAPTPPPVAVAPSAFSPPPPAPPAAVSTPAAPASDPAIHPKKPAPTWPPTSEAISVAPPAVVANAVGRTMSALAARGPEYEAIAKLSREIIEQVVWEVVPELAEVIIRQEIDRLAAAKK